MSETEPSTPSNSGPGKRVDKRESFRQAARIFRYLLPYRWRFLASVGSLFISASLGLAFPYLTGQLLDASRTHPGNGSGPSAIDHLALTLLATLAVQAAFSFISSYGFNRCGESALVDLRRETFAHLLGQPMTFFAQRRVGELSSRLGTDLAVIQDTLTSTIPQFLRQSALMVGGITLIAVTSLRLSAVMISTFPVLLLAAIFMGRRIRGLSRSGQDRLAEGATVVEESLHGIAGVKAFGNEHFELDRYTRSLNAFLQIILRTARMRASLISFIIFGVFGSIVLVFWYGARLMLAGELSFGELTRFLLYTTFVGGSVASFAEVFSQVQKTLGATERVRELMNEPEEIVVLKRVARLVRPATRLTGAVQFDHVDFCYPSRPDTLVLKDLVLEAAPGEKIALVGPSGAGKSTIVSLLLRFYDPVRGSLRFDGRPATEIPVEELRQHLAIVPQEVLLFGGTIEENIRYGRPDATPEEVRLAAKRAVCHEFVERFPEGYSTLVGERGVKLSGGQRQRIAIARALLKNPAILILDEATSSLDSENEHLIQQALEVLLEGRTAFIIAHRLSTIRHANRIYFIESGSVLESGTHSELIRKENGAYRRLAEMQAGQGLVK